MCGKCKNCTCKINPVKRVEESIDYEGVNKYSVLVNVIKLITKYSGKKIKLNIKLEVVGNG